jgi:hypothetical protein
VVLNPVRAKIVKDLKETGNGVLIGQLAAIDQVIPGLTTDGILSEIWPRAKSSL